MTPRYATLKCPYHNTQSIVLCSCPQDGPKSTCTHYTHVAVL